MKENKNSIMKICSASLIIREMQVKTTVRYQFISVRMATVKKKTKNSNSWLGCRVIGTTCLLRNVYAGQEATVRTGHGTTDLFQIRKRSTSRLYIVTLLI